MAKSSNLSKTAVWILMALLIFGLAGFGITNLGGNIRTIGTVGDKPIGTSAYFTAVQREIRTREAQFGQSLTFAQARDLGLDRLVLQQLVSARALDSEATRMGLSIGDENLREQLLQSPMFQGLDGNFDRESYSFALENQGVTEAEFEDQLRDETARSILQAALLGATTMPESFADQLVTYAGEPRDFTWATVASDAIEKQPPAPTGDELRAYHRENQDTFTLPVTKQITYAWLPPETLIDSVELDDAALRQSYEERIQEFVQPERRLVERLIYPDQDTATQAAAQLDVDGTTFESLVEDRGLDLSDVDMGDVDQASLGEAGEGVFAASTGEVVGPFPTNLGPALFRVNAILDGRNTSYEDALPVLREELALLRARRLVEAQAESYDDMLAGGATLEDLASETDMELGQIDWTPDTDDGIAAFDTFRTRASQVTLDDFPEIEVLEDGGVFAIRLDEELPERPQPFESARETVIERITQERVETALQTLAEERVAQINGGQSFIEASLAPVTEIGRTRGAFIPSMPFGFMDQIFEMSPGDLRIIPAPERVVIVRLDAIGELVANEESAQLRDNLQQSLDQSLAQDLFQIYANDVLSRTEQNINMNAVEAVNANFP